MRKRSIGESRETANLDINSPNEAKRLYPIVLVINGVKHGFQFTANQLRVARERWDKNPKTRVKHSGIKEIRDLFRVLAFVVGASLVVATQSGCSMFGVARIMEPPMSKTDLAEIAANVGPGQSAWLSYSTASVQADRMAEIGNDGQITPSAMMDLISFGAGMGGDAVEAALAQAINKNRSADVVMYVGEHKAARDSFVAFQAAKLKPGTVILSLGNNAELIVPPTMPITETGPIVIALPTNVVVETNAPIVESEEPATLLVPADGEVPFDPADVPQVKNKVDYRGMAVVPLLASAKIEGANVRYDGMPPGDWWKLNAGGGVTKTHVRMHVAWVDSAGNVQGGHFDWMRPNQAGVKTLNNLKNGYVGARPQPGAVLYMWWIDQQGSRRTNIVRVEGAV